MFSLEIRPRFPRHRAGNRSSVSSNIRPRKSVPNLERGQGGPSLRPFAYKLNYAKFGWPARPYKSICYIAIDSCPARPPQSKLQNPKSKTAVWILDFGFWMDFGFLDLGFWISDFGFWILRTVWILHKIIATARGLGSADCSNLWFLHTLKYLGSGMVYPRYHPIQGLTW